MLPEQAGQYQSPEILKLRLEGFKRIFVEDEQLPVFLNTRKLYNIIPFT